MAELDQILCAHYCLTPSLLCLVEEAMSQRIQMVSKSWKRQENAPEPPERTIALLTP